MRPLGALARVDPFSDGPTAIGVLGEAHGGPGVGNVGRSPKTYTPEAPALVTSSCAERRYPLVPF